ncbi:MAG: SpoIIE family protein phosphatase [Verrucomicrobiota bacterium]
MQTPSKGYIANPSGTTMRIEISPEAIHETKRKAKSSSARLSLAAPREPRLSVGAEPLGGLHFQQLLQNIYDGVLVTDLSGQILGANIRANSFFLCTPGQLHNYNILTLICGANDSLLPTILKTLEGNRFILMQAYCRRMDETTFPVEISVNRLAIAGMDCLSFFVRDVTVRKEQEERLRTGNTAIQNASSGIAVAGLNAEIVYCNPAFLSYFGLSSEQVEALPNFREFLCEPALADEVIAAIWKGKTWAGELELKVADGKILFGHTSVTPNLDADGELVGMVFSVLDVTPQKRAQQQLQIFAEELQQKNVQMEDDLKMASELHQAFLPLAFEGFPRDVAPENLLLEIRHLYQPSGIIGGDFFDIREISDHEVAVFISDVMGHGVRSALVVAMIRGLIEQMRPLATDPGALMTHLNATYSKVFQHLGGDVLFATALYVVFDTRTGLLRYANASQPQPYVLRPTREELLRLQANEENPSAPLGLFATANYETQSFQLEPQDLLLLYTDGLSEAESPGGEFFDASRFEKTLRDNLYSTPKTLIEGLLADAQSFSAAEAFSDDICLLAIKVLRLTGE